MNFVPKRQAMKSSKEFLEMLSTTLYQHKTTYAFSKDKKMDKCYKEGRVRVYEWANALCYEYLKQESMIPKKIKDSIIKKRDTILDTIDDEQTKQGIKDSFEDVLETLDKL